LDGLATKKRFGFHFGISAVFLVTACLLTAGNEIPVDYQWRDLEKIARTTVSKWMKSPGHRQNILETAW
jgi:hypothetical protein